MKKPPLKKTKPKAAKPLPRRTRGQARARAAPRAAKKTPPLGLPRTFFGRLAGRLAELLGAGIVMALVTPKEAIRAAGGDLIEAMGGHRCGPECWHAIGDTPEDKQAWWDKKLADYDASAAPTPPAAPAVSGLRCPVKYGCTHQCVHAEGHHGAHQDELWKAGKSGGVSWWA